MQQTTATASLTFTLNLLAVICTVLVTHCTMLAISSDLHSAAMLAFKSMEQPMVKELTQDASQAEIDFPLVTPLLQWHGQLFNTDSTFWKWMARSIK